MHVYIYIYIYIYMYAYHDDNDKSSVRVSPTAPRSERLASPPVANYIIVYDSIIA